MNGIIETRIFVMRSTEVDKTHQWAEQSLNACLSIVYRGRK